MKLGLGAVHNIHSLKNDNDNTMKKNTLRINCTNVLSSLSRFLNCSYCNIVLLFRAIATEHHYTLY